MIKLILFGNLMTEFGKERNLCVSSFKEIFKSLEANTKKFRKFILYQHKQGVYYRVIINDRPIASLFEMEYKFIKNKSYEVKIMPVPMGKFGSTNTRGASYLSLGLGAIFVAAGAAFLASGIGSAVAVPLIFAGVTLLASGVIGLLSPQPKFQPDLDQKQSFLFDGILETAREGLPVPVVYGRLLIQGITVNSQINTIDTDGTGTGYDACGDSAS